MTQKVFIFVSSALRGTRYLGLADDTIDVLILPQGRMIVEKEPSSIMPDPWETELKRLVVERIKSHDEWKESIVRIAGHLKPCFGDLAIPGQPADQRFPEKEKGLIDELGHEIDIQIWGFHRDTKWSEIWSVASEVIHVVDNPSEAKQAAFLEALEEAFAKAAKTFENRPARDEEERLRDLFSVTRHEIIGMFDPLRIRLETASEINTKEPDRAGTIRASVDESIDAKLPGARRVLAGCARDVAAGEPEQWFKKASEQLGMRPSLSEFRSWLDALNDNLSKLRKSVTSD